MGNRVRGIVDIEGESGETYKMQYSLNSLCELEDVLDGRTVIEFAESLGNDPSKMKFKDLRRLLWAGMIEHNEGIDEDEAGRIVEDCGGFAVMFPKMIEAFQAALPDDDGAGEGAGKGKAKARSKR